MGMLRGRDGVIAAQGDDDDGDDDDDDGDGGGCFEVLTGGDA